MKRIYISDWQDRKPVGMRTPVDVFFVFKPEEAHAWPSREQARTECEMYFNPYGVSVDWTEDGSEYVCKFQVEEHSPRAFVLFCDGPFVFKAQGAKPKV
jgi:hypothetical protein